MVSFSFLIIHYRTFLQGRWNENVRNENVEMCDGFLIWEMIVSLLKVSFFAIVVEILGSWTYWFAGVWITVVADGWQE